MNKINELLKRVKAAERNRKRLLNAIDSTLRGLSADIIEKIDQEHEGFFKQWNRDRQSISFRQLQKVLEIAKEK